MSMWGVGSDDGNQYHREGVAECDNCVKPKKLLGNGALIAYHQLRSISLHTQGRPGSLGGLCVNDYNVPLCWPEL